MTKANHNKTLKKILKDLTPVFLVTCIGIAVTVLIFGFEDPTIQQRLDLQEEFTTHGIRYILQASISGTVTESIEHKEDFLQLIDTYQPKILYMNYNLNGMTYTFFEDEDTMLIVYHWYCKFDYYGR